MEDPQHDCPDNPGHEARPRPCGPPLATGDADRRTQDAEEHRCGHALDGPTGTKGTDTDTGADDRECKRHADQQRRLVTRAEQIDGPTLDAEGHEIDDAIADHRKR